MESEDSVRTLRKHPLAIRTLDLLTSQNEALNLQTIASNLGVHKVSAHRVMRLLTGMRIVCVRKGKDGRYRYFIIPNSRTPQVKRLIQAVKGARQVPMGRGLAHATILMESSVRRSLEARGLEVRLTPRGPYDMLIRTGELTVGLELKAFERLSVRRRFNEFVGHVMTSQIPSIQATVIVLIGPEDKRLVEEAHDLEARLKGAGIKLKFLWIAEDPLEVDSLLIEKKIVEPLVQLLQEWDSNPKSSDH